MVNDGMGLVPLWNFAPVTDNLYRSAKPEQDFTFDWMMQHGFSDIIDLRAETDERTDALRELAKSTGLKLTVVGIEDDTAPTKEQAQSILDAIATAQGRVLVHCSHGHGRTSTACCLVMIRGGMSPDAAIESQQTMFGYTFKNAVQANFIRSWR